MEVIDTTLRTQNSPTANQWYNLGSIQISVPIGLWDLSYSTPISVYRSSSGALEVHSSLSTSNNSESDAGFTCLINKNPGTDLAGQVVSSLTANLVSKTTFYLLIRTNNSGITAIYFLNNRTAVTRIRATCSYL